MPVSPDSTHCLPASGTAGQQDEAALLAQAVIAGEFTPEVRAWLQRGFAQRERLRGTLALDRCLRLPTFKASRRLERDQWIAIAFQCLPTSAPQTQASELHSLLKEFAARGPFQAWLRAGGPPLFATELQRALFEVLSAQADVENGRRAALQPLCTKTLLRALQQHARTNSPHDLSTVFSHTETQANPETQRTAAAHVATEPEPTDLAYS
jgi:hypothetical protein